jgi:hypothetical protein
VAKVGTSNSDCTISLKRLQCVVENIQMVLGVLHLHNHTKFWSSESEVKMAGGCKEGQPTGTHSIVILKAVIPQLA